MAEVGIRATLHQYAASHCRGLSRDGTYSAQPSVFRPTDAGGRGAAGCLYDSDDVGGRLQPGGQPGLPH